MDMGTALKTAVALIAAMLSGVQLADTLDYFYHGEYGKGARFFVYFVVNIFIAAALLFGRW